MSQKQNDIDLGEYIFLEGKLVKKVDHSKYKFISNEHRDALFVKILQYIQIEMENQFGFIRVQIPQSYVYISPNTECEVVMLLIQGSGGVRPGQWTRKLCTDDSLETGSILPQLKVCQQRGWGCCVFNPNQRSQYPPNENEHCTYIINHIVIPHFPKMKHILAIAHSAGGFGVSSLLQNSPRAMQLLRGVAFTDSFYDVSNKLSKEHLMQFYSVAVHWVCSDTQLNEPVGNQRIEDDNKEENLEVVKQQCVTISAGTQQHEMSTGMAQYSIYEYFDAKMEEIGYKLDDPSLKEEGRQKQKDNNKPAWLQRVLRRQQRFAQWIQENVKETKQ